MSLQLQQADSPVWDHDEELAQRYATQLAGTLLAVIPAHALAVAWRAYRAAGGTDDPRQFLRDAGVLAGILAALTAVLVALWAAGWALGADAGNELASSSVDLGNAALDDFLEEAEDERLEGMAETRLGQIADALEDDDGGPQGDLITAIEQEIGSEVRALLVTQTETTWAISQGLLGVFHMAGATTVAWITARDPRVCPRCAGNQAAGYILSGTPFPSGDASPPAHPSCRCSLIPGDILGAPLPITPMSQWLPAIAA